MFSLRCLVYPFPLPANYRDNCQVCITAGEDIHTEGPSSTLSNVYKSPLPMITARSSFKTDHLSPPCRPPTHTLTRVLLVPDGRADSELDPFSGEGSDDPSTYCVCWIKFDRLIKIALLLRPSPDVTLWRKFDSIWHAQEYKAAWELVKIGRAHV